MPRSGRLTAVAVALALAVGVSSASADGGPSGPAATPSASCGPGSVPEATQGRAPLADFSNGRGLLGYSCNAELVSRTGRTGAYRTHSYTDLHGRTCAYFDTTNVYLQSVVLHGDYGTVVVDMTDPEHPVQTARLTTQAFAMPHESMSISRNRGLLMAAASTNATGPAVVDIYNLAGDCRYPKLLSSTPLGFLGHEGAVTADGLTYWVSSNAGAIAAVDISKPILPSMVYFSIGQVQVHGLSLSPDGNTLYGAANGEFKGLQVYDVSQIQARAALPAASLISHLTWPEVSVPQTTIPITIRGHHYLIEVDELAGVVSADATAPVGAARIIDIEDVRRPAVVSHLRLQVNQPGDRLGDQVNDPGAGNQFVGYAAHYCSVPRQDDPELVACSFLASGLRVFNISDPVAPLEVAYFNHPQDTPGDMSGSSSFSQPAWDLEHQSVWFADGNHGFFAVRLTNDVWPSSLTAPAAGELPGATDPTARLIGSSANQVVGGTTGVYDQVYGAFGK
jgi:hypothetical protein